MRLPCHEKAERPPYDSTLGEHIFTISSLPFYPGTVSFNLPVDSASAELMATKYNLMTLYRFEKGVFSNDHNSSTDCLAVNDLSTCESYYKNDSNYDCWLSMNNDCPMNVVPEYLIIYHTDTHQIIEIKELSFN